MKLPFGPVLSVCMTLEAAQACLVSISDRIGALAPILCCLQLGHRTCSRPVTRRVIVWVRDAAVLICFIVG